MHVEVSEAQLRLGDSGAKVIVKDFLGDIVFTLPDGREGDENVTMGEMNIDGKVEGTVEFSGSSPEDADAAGAPDIASYGTTVSATLKFLILKDPSTEMKTKIVNPTLDINAEYVQADPKTGRDAQPRPSAWSTRVNHDTLVYQYRMFYTMSLYCTGALPRLVTQYRPITRAALRIPKDW